ncbi:nuclear prelamin A recognition factor-like protein [Martensiomyces pterosporus]|nr:nuclear prelamin A recognition factor-like protein [Martensiomyces pterosporus]
MSFSGGLRLTDLNDYITPGQECIKPVEVKKTGKANGSQIKVGQTGDYYEVSKDGEETKLEAARITLNDCLACSGCVTSAETVLITMQSHHELVKVLEENRQLRDQGQGGKAKHVVVTVAPQSRASLAVKYQMSMLNVAKRMTGVLKAMGVDYVFDSAFARDLTLVESAREFVDRYKQSHGQVGDSHSLPVLASWCPGWVCYAEKTHAEVLPWMSTTRSPQQIMGAVVKGYLAKKLGVTADRIYHVAVMMCYDKKLEASRDDFYSDIYKTRDVDCVVTTGEFDRLLAESGQSMVAEAAEQEEAVALDSLFKTSAASDQLYTSAGTSAGGGLEYIMSYAARTLFSIQISPDEIAAAGKGEQQHPLIQVKLVRNQSDHREITLIDPATREPRLRFATVYGFRHLQNLVRKLKSGRSAYHYVEVAACPSACSNGGGQIQPEDPSPAAKKQWVAETERVYASSDASQLPEDNKAVGELIYDWFGPEGLDSELAKQALHTQFHGVVAKANSLGVSW